MSLAELVANIPPAQTSGRNELSNALSQRKVQYRTFPVTLEAMNHFWSREKPIAGVPLESSACWSNPAARSPHDPSSPLLMCPGRRYKHVERLLVPEDHTSQFREREIALRPAYRKWMPAVSDRMSTLDLWVHMTFALPNPACKRGDASSDEASAIALDLSSGELNTLRSVFWLDLPHYISTQSTAPAYDEFLAQWRLSVLSSASCVAALDGSWTDFPLAKL